MLCQGVLPTNDGKHDLLTNRDSGLLKICFHLHFKPIHRTFLMLCLCPRLPCPCKFPARERLDHHLYSSSIQGDFHFLLVSIAIYILIYSFNHVTFYLNKNLSQRVLHSSLFDPMMPISPWLCLSRPLCILILSFTQLSLTLRIV